MGIVCTALARDLGTVAVKIPKALGDRHVRDRVLREGNLLAKVHHTNVLRVHEVGEWDGAVYIVTEYVEGQTLRAWQSAPGRGWRAIVRAYLQAGHGLAAIHARQIVHQDIKPDNIRVDLEGTVRVLDFGLAHLESHVIAATTATPGDGASTRPTFYRGGTPGYMAPEQYQHDQPVDVRADQFAFCAALWEALHGTLPYAPGQIASTVVGTPRRPLGLPANTRGSGPGWLDSILLRGLAEAPGARFPDMRALTTAIERRLDRRRWPVFAAGGVAGLGGALLSALLAAPELPMCAAPASTAAQLLAESREPELAAVAATLTAPTAARNFTATRDRLAAQRRRWSELHATSCRQALVVGDPATALAREPCMAARRQELALVADAMLRFASRHAADPHAAWDRERERWEQQLRPIDDCLSARPAIAALRGDAGTPLRHARTVLLSDGPTAARPLLARALVVADKFDDRRTRAEVRLELGRVALELQDNHVAGEHLAAAVRDAEAGGDDLTAADAEAWLVQLVGDRSDHPQMARLLFERAMGRLERLDLEHSGRAFDLHLRTANAARRSGHTAAAALLLDRASALRRSLGDDEHRLAREEQHRADLAEATGDLGTARATIRSALARFQRALGPDSASVAMALRTLGKHERQAGDFVAAELALLRALEIFRQRGGADSLEAATVHVELASVYSQSGRPSHALHHARASAALEHGGEPRHRAWQSKQAATRGELELTYTRRFDRAAAHYRRGLALAETAAASPAERDNLTLMRLGLAQAELLRGRLVDADAALVPLIVRVDDPSLADRRPYILLTAGEVALAAVHPELAATRAQATLAGLSPEQRAASVPAAEALWLLARALGPDHAAGRSAATRTREMLRITAVADGTSFTSADLDRWLRP